MNINIGDKVRFLNDVGGGVVVKIISKSQVLVQDDNEFEYPFPVNELVVIEKAVEQPEIPKQTIEKKQIPQVNKPKNNIELKTDNDSEVLFAFVKKNKNDQNCFDYFLINDSNYYIFYHIVLRGDNGYEKLDAEIIEPNTQICIGELTQSQINFSKEIIIQMLLFDHPYQVLHQMTERKIKIVPINFFQEHRFLENDFLDDNAYIFELLKEKQGLGESIKTQEDFENNILQKDIFLEETEREEDESKKYRPRKKPATIEVDLHINQLVESVIGLSNAEILQIQMDKFHKTMTNAIMNKAGRVILIHGIGNGTLKAAIRDSLEIQYKLHYEDASFQEYGFGATMVEL